MSIDCHMKLAGVSGESTHKDHTGEIQLNAWNWSVAQPASGSGSGTGLGKGVPGAFTFTHAYDKASPVLAQKCASGKHFDDAVVTVRKAGDGQQDFLKVTMKTVFITSVTPGASSGGEVVESVRMDYDDIEFAYKPQEGNSLGGEVKFGWNPKKADIR